MFTPFKRSMVVVTGAAALAAASCSAPPPDRKTMMAHAWTCEMVSEADGLRSVYTETMDLRPAGDYRSKVAVNATGENVQVSMQLEWTGRWALSEDTFRRTFAAVKATTGERNGLALTQDLLDKAANELRRAPVAEEGRVLSLTENEMQIETNFDPMICKR